MIREIAAFTAPRVRKLHRHNRCTPHAQPMRTGFAEAGFAIALIFGSLFAATPARAVSSEVIAEHLNYCLKAVAAKSPRGVPVPLGIDANDEKALATGGRVNHLIMGRDSRDDWTCVLGDKSQRLFPTLVEEFLRNVETVDKSRSRYNGNLYMTATICVGAEAVAMILNGPETRELGLATAVFTTGITSKGCQ